jgi:anti-anti-sigma factor
MKLSSTLINGTVVISLSGKILGEAAERTRFLGTIQEHIALNKTQFVIDLDGVERINSIGLGLLIAGYNSVIRQGGNFVLANITNVESLLSLTRLSKVFNAYDSTDMAVALVSGNKTAK